VIAVEFRVAGESQSLSSVRELAKLIREWPVFRLVDTWDSTGVAPWVRKGVTEAG